MDSYKVLMTLYVDDLLIFGSNIECINETKSFLPRTFDIKDLGPVDVILGIKVIKKDDHRNAWRVGQVVPHEYRHSRYVIDYRQHQKLTKPGRYQKWYKVNGNYVLVNEQSHKIIRVVY